MYISYYYYNKTTVSKHIVSNVEKNNITYDDFMRSCELYELLTYCRLQIMMRVLRNSFWS